ncbi:MAG: peptidylprolyl isomerase [Planctomycetes bacterium]|nr:peptidylprolyl isomerase [Planctomycetota bacterium]
MSDSEKKVPEEQKKEGPGSAFQRKTEAPAAPKTKRDDGRGIERDAFERTIDRALEKASGSKALQIGSIAVLVAIIALVAWYQSKDNSLESSVISATLKAEQTLNEKGARDLDRLKFEKIYIETLREIISENPESSALPYTKYRLADALLRMQEPDDTEAAVKRTEEAVAILGELSKLAEENEIKKSSTELLANAESRLEWLKSHTLPHANQPIPLDRLPATIVEAGTRPIVSVRTNRQEYVFELFLENEDCKNAVRHFMELCDAKDSKLASTYFFEYESSICAVFGEPFEKGNAVDRKDFENDVNFKDIPAGQRIDSFASAAYDKREGWNYLAGKIEGSETAYIPVPGVYVPDGNAKEDELKQHPRSTSDIGLLLVSRRVLAHGGREFVITLHGGNAAQFARNYIAFGRVVRPSASTSLASLVSSGERIVQTRIVSTPGEAEVGAIPYTVAMPDVQLPIVRIDTERGSLFFELFEDEAPVTVANFLDRAEKHYYDRTRFFDCGGVNVLSELGSAPKPDVVTFGSPAPDGSYEDPQRIPLELSWRRAGANGGRLLMRSPKTEANPDNLRSSTHVEITRGDLSARDSNDTIFGRIVGPGYRLRVEAPAGEGEAPAAPAGFQLGDEVPVATLLKEIGDSDRITRIEVIRKRGHGYRFDRKY